MQDQITRYDRTTLTPHRINIWLTESENYRRYTFLFWVKKIDKYILLIIWLMLPVSNNYLNAWMLLNFLRVFWMFRTNFNSNQGKIINYNIHTGKIYTYVQHKYCQILLNVCSRSFQVETLVETNSCKLSAMPLAKESTTQKELMQIIPQLAQSDNSAPLSFVLL